MQNQVISNNLRGKNPSRQRGKKKLEPPKDDEENNCKMMIVKSLSIEQNASLVTRPLYCKRSKSSLNQIHMNNIKLRKQVDRIEKSSKNETGQSIKPEIALKGQVQCIQHCRQFNKGKKIDFLWRIKDIQRRIAKDFRNAKIRQNRRYIGESKDNKTKMIANCSVEISSLIKVRPFQNTQESVPLDGNKSHKRLTFQELKFSKHFKHNKIPSNSQKKHIKFFNSTIKHRSFYIQPYPSENQGFQGWKTFSEYDF